MFTDSDQIMLFNYVIRAANVIVNELKHFTNVYAAKDSVHK